MTSDEPNYASRGAHKLVHALDTFGLNVTDLTCADLGCSTGGFTDVLLRRGAAKVYAVDTGYGVLDWRLRNDERVVVMERTNAMHVTLPEPVAFVTIDASWTKQSRVLPNVANLLAAGGQIVTLVKPHYEAPKSLLRKGVLIDEHREDVLARVRDEITSLGFTIRGEADSPITGGKSGPAGNVERLVWLTRA